MADFFRPSPSYLATMLTPGGNVMTPGGTLMPASTLLSAGTDAGQPPVSFGLSNTTSGTTAANGTTAMTAGGESLLARELNPFEQSFSSIATRSSAALLPHLPRMPATASDSDRTPMLQLMPSTTTTNTTTASTNTSTATSNSNTTTTAANHFPSGNAASSHGYFPFVPSASAQFAGVVGAFGFPSATPAVMPSSIMPPSLVALPPARALYPHRHPPSNTSNTSITSDTPHDHVSTSAATNTAAAAVAASSVASTLCSAAAVDPHRLAHDARSSSVSSSTASLPPVTTSAPNKPKKRRRSYKQIPISLPPPTATATTRASSVSSDATQNTMSIPNITSTSTSSVTANNTLSLTDASSTTMSIQERNRLAASKCRQRKRIFIATLEKKADDLQKENLQLTRQYDDVKAEIERVRVLLESCTTCRLRRY